jgi:hypothetical protein
MSGRAPSRGDPKFRTPFQPLIHVPRVGRQLHTGDEGMSRVESLRVIVAIARKSIPNQMRGQISNELLRRKHNLISFALDEPRMNHVMIAPGRAEHMHLLLQPSEY